MKILAIDVGRSTGVALGSCGKDKVPGLIRVATFLPDVSPGDFSKWLGGYPDLTLVEYPNVDPHATTFSEMQKLTILWKQLAFDCGGGFGQEVSPSEWKGTPAKHSTFWIAGTVHPKGPHQLDAARIFYWYTKYKLE